MKNSIIVFLLALCSCQNKTAKKEQLDMNTMKTVVWQLMQTDEYFTRVSLLDSTWRLGRRNIKMYQQVFDLNKVDRVVFYNTIDFLERHPVEFRLLMDSVQEVSKREKLKKMVIK